MHRAYAAVLPTPPAGLDASPLAMLGLRVEDGVLAGVDFLPVSAAPCPPREPFARQVCAQFEAYWADPGLVFDVPLAPRGTPFQQRVWAALQSIPTGATLTYGELAARLKTGPRAVGQACGANPLPVIIPCHRVVGAGHAGGFMQGREETALALKAWLLTHERRLRPI